MVETVSIYDLEAVEIFKNKLSSIFSKENLKARRYAEVWLTVDTFGGLIGTEAFVVHVKMENEIEARSTEIKYISLELFEELTQDENNLILNLRIYKSDERIRYNPYQGDIKILLTH